MEESQSIINWQEIAVKGRSKKEIYRILTLKGKYYLPPEPQTNSDFIHDIMVGKKKVRLIISSESRF